MKPFLMISAIVLALSACAPAPAPVPVYDPSIDVTPGLNDKEPDTCRAGNFTYYVGRPIAELQTAVAGKELLVMAPGSLGSQEYNAGRINAFVDEAGLVYRLSCG